MSFFKGVKQGMNFFGECISTIITSTLLALVYIFGVGFTAILAKLLGKKLLPKQSGTTYWSDTTMGTEDKEHYHRQF